MQSLFTLVTIFASLTFIANIFICIGVWKDAERIQNSIGAELKILSAPQWAIACLFAGFPILAIYALLHYSNLIKQN